MKRHLFPLQGAFQAASTKTHCGRGQGKAHSLECGATYLAVASCLPWHLRTYASCHLLTYLRVLQLLDGKNVLVRAAALEENLEKRGKSFTLILQEEQLDQAMLLSPLPPSPQATLQAEEIWLDLPEQVLDLRRDGGTLWKARHTRVMLKDKAQRQEEMKRWQEIRLVWAVYDALFD